MKLFLMVCSLLIAYNSSCKNPALVIYLIPGQGSDYRLFNNLDLVDDYDVRYIHHCVPSEGMDMSEYAKELSNQIDTDSPFVLIGVSLGGMLSVELNEICKPERTIIISSAKSRNELPGRYRFQADLPIYSLISPEMSKKGALFLQPIVEPDRNIHKDTFISMLTDKDPDFLKRTIAMIIEWDRVDYPEHIIHIHGDKDKTIPIRNVKYDYLIAGGSHMMTLTQGDQVSLVIREILRKL